MREKPKYMFMVLERGKKMCDNISIIIRPEEAEQIFVADSNKGILTCDIDPYHAGLSAYQFIKQKGQGE